MRLIFTKRSTLPDLAQGHFIESGQTQINSFDCRRKYASFSILGAPQPPSNELSPAKQVLSGIYTPTSRNTRCIPENQESIFFPYLPRGGIWHNFFFLLKRYRGGRGCAWVSVHALLVISSPGPKARCKLINTWHWFIKCNVNLWLSMLVNDSRSQKA